VTAQPLAPVIPSSAVPASRQRARSAAARRLPLASPRAPAYLHHYDLRTLTEQSASCYQVTGHADRAVTILQDTIAATSPALVRDRGHLTAKLAVACTRIREPDPARAAALGLDALAAARQTGSARILGELQTLGQRLTAQWPAHPATRTVREALAA
jgi:hypothetical protein